METDSIVSQLKTFGDEVDHEISAYGEALDASIIETLRIKYLGKKGHIAGVMKQMGQMTPEDRRKTGEVANKIKKQIERSISNAKITLEKLILEKNFKRTLDDIPSHPFKKKQGNIHLLSQARNDIVHIFSQRGFTVATGPELENEFNNFEALGIPKHHPARDMQDTFYIDKNCLLRTHTSPVQIRTMLNQEPPIRIIAPGTVYRRDDDPTHSPMFMQVEALLIEPYVVSMADLKGLLHHFIEQFFQKDLGIRFRPSYFPFVEPGAEVDMECSFCSQKTKDSCRVCKGTRWLEIAGCGMVDPVVFEKISSKRQDSVYSSDNYNGFAFGFGLDRMAMLRHGVSNIRHLYESDVRFLRQF